MRQIDFNGLSLAVQPGRVMTPRAASERLVAEALDRLGDRAARVVDVGTGSGAIAVAIASAAPNVHVFATDTSRCAVSLARANVRLHGLGDRVTVCHGDLLEPVPGPIDLVVANLPYLPIEDAARYPDLAGEPVTAIYTPGDGLDPYRRLLAACSARLREDGAVVIQLHRQVIAVTGRELPKLRERLAAVRPEYVPQLAAA